MIRSLIIDDQADSREALQLAVDKYCPEVRVLQSCETPEQGLEAIKRQQPDLVFLDVQMPRMSGFDILEKFDRINFEVIFVTAYNKYAIKAIRFSALDYLLKPVEIDELTQAVRRVKDRKDQKDTLYKYQSMLENIKSQPGNIEKLAIPTLEGIVFLQTADIIYCRADGNYTTVYLTGNQKNIVSKKLKDFENLLSDSGFCRVHHSSLINLKHIKKYVKGEGGYIILTGNHHVDVSRRKKDEFLALLDML